VVHPIEGCSSGGAIERRGSGRSLRFGDLRHLDPSLFVNRLDGDGRVTVGAFERARRRVVGGSLRDRITRRLR